MDYSSLFSSGSEGGLTSDVTGLGIKEQRDKEKALGEFRDQLRGEATFNYGQNKRTAERMQDLAPELTGQLSTEYVTSDMLLPQSREDIGGVALENILNASSGYNPTMSFDPAMQVYGADRQAVGDLRDFAEQRTDQTLTSFEDRMAGLGEAYDQAGDQLTAERDRVKDVYTERVAEDREAGTSDMARTIVEAWITSNDKAGTLGEGRFLNTGPAGRFKNTKKDNKRDFVNEQLASGKTYEDLLSDPEFAKYLHADRNASTYLSQYEGDKAGPASGRPDPADYGGEQTAGYQGALAEWQRNTGR